jgi:hypothetical protein
MIAEDQAMVRQALVALLELEPDSVTALAEGDSPLTARETDVLVAAAGHDVITEIAGRLHL